MINLANEFIIEELKNKINNAVNNNIIVFDSDAQSGRFTRRLVALMKIVFLHDNKDKLYTIYVSPEFISGVHAEKEIMDRFYRPNSYMKVYGVNIVEMPESLLDYYKNDLGASLAGDDEQIILGENKKGTEFILGSY